MPFKNDFFWILIDFETENGAKLTPKSSQKSMLTSNSWFSRNTIKTNRKLMIFLNFGAQVRSQNPLKSRQISIFDSVFFGSFFRSFFYGFECHLGAQVGPQKRPKWGRKPSWILDRFGGARKKGLGPRNLGAGLRGANRNGLTESGLSARL